MKWHIQHIARAPNKNGDFVQLNVYNYFFEDEKNAIKAFEDKRSEVCPIDEFTSGMWEVEDYDTTFRCWNDVSEHVLTVCEII